MIQSLTYKALNLDSFGLGAILVEVTSWREKKRRYFENLESHPELYT